VLDGIFVLRLRVSVAYFNRVEFIGPDAMNKRSCRPAFLSKNHFSPLFTNGMGNGHSSLPTKRKARLPLSESTDTDFLSRASAAKSAVLPV
jgi:hypothetical protein